MANEIVTIYYMNWKHERSYRRIHPHRLYFGSTEHHPEPQWLLEALDCDKDEMRTFAMRDVIQWVAH